LARWTFLNDRIDPTEWATSCSFSVMTVLALARWHGDGVIPLASPVLLRLGNPYVDHDELQSQEILISLLLMQVS
jgi:hypothetical protein